jgi:hypothetical protein
VSILEKIGFKNYEKEHEMFKIGTTNIQICQTKLKEQVFEIQRLKEDYCEIKQQLIAQGTQTHVLKRKIDLAR